MSTFVRPGRRQFVATCDTESALLRELIHELKVSDEEFRAPFDDSHGHDRQIYRIEQDTELVAEDSAAQLKRWRTSTSRTGCSRCSETRSAREPPDYVAARPCAPS